MGPSQNVTTAVQSKGQGSYTCKAWIKLASGTDTGKVTLKVVDGSGTKYVNMASASINSTGWTQLSGTQNVTWTGTLSSVLFYIETGSTLVNEYVDDCSMTR
jgi:hypothetical protein